VRRLGSITIRAGVVLCLLTGATGAWADYNDGVEAFTAGDFAAAIAEWQPLAEEGDAASQFGLGLIYESGKGVGRDYREAVAWYELAAAQGHPGAQFNLGHLYRLGAGVPPDMGQAVAWWTAAAEQDLPRARVILGLAYQRGDGVEHDPVAAAAWFQRAADQGNPMGMYAIGFAFETGSGVAQDLDQARIYYEAAAAAGVQQAIERLTALAFPPTPETPPPPPTENEVLERVAEQVADDQQANGGAEALEPTATTPDGPLFIQIAAYVDQERAEREWRNIVDRHPDLLEGLPHRVASFTRDDCSPVYRLQAGPLPINEEAQAICDLLQEQDTDCFLVRD